MPARYGFRLSGVPTACGCGERGGIVVFLPLCCCAQQRVVLGSVGWEKLQYVPERFGPTSGTKNEPPVRWAVNSCDRLPVNRWTFCLAVIESGRRAWYITGTGQTQVRSNLEPFVSNSEAKSPPIDRRSEEHTSELQSPDHLVCR